MKKYLIAATFLLAISSCRDKGKFDLLTLKQPTVQMKAVMLAPPKQNSVKFPPPVVMADDEVVGNADAKKADYAPPQENTVIKDTSKKIIKEGDIHFETKDIARTRKALLHTLEGFGGYAEEDNESLDSGADRKEYNIKARIPAKNFDRFFDSVSISAIRVDSKHSSVSDVTTEYIDMTTRLKNQKILESSYLGLLKRASKMSDVLQIEDKVTDTRTEIESEQGQLNYLNKQIAYSTLDITFYTKQIQHDTVAGQGYKLSSAISDGWLLLQNLFFGLIAIWPLVLLGITAIFGFRKWKKNKKVTVKASA